MTTDQTASPEITTPFDRYRVPMVVVGIAGLAVLIAGAFSSPEEFFRSWLVGFIFWFGVSIGALGILMVQYLTGGAWGVLMRRPLEAASRTLPLTALFFVPILFGMHSIYEWTHEDVVQGDALLRHKAIYLNIPFFAARAIVFFGIWLAFAYLMNRWSKKRERTDSPWYALKLRGISAGGLVTLGLTLSFASVDWMMSLEPHWFSTMYGISFVVGNLLSGFAFVVLIVVMLSGYEPVSKLAKPMTFRDFGNLMLAFVMLWAYTAFSEYLLIWYGNLKEEIPWYLRRVAGGWGAIAVLLLVFHFFLPFVMLLMRGIKDRPRALGMVAGLILVMRVVDIQWLIMPAYGDGHVSYWKPVLAVVGMGGIWMAVFIWQLRRNALLPMNETTVQEALVENGALSHG